jgi:transcription initiation factor TFIIIB Brf1 subunit/transcription initiation factor TFIIB
MLDINECPDCASTNIVHGMMRDQVICRDCGLIFEEPAPAPVIKPVKIVKPKKTKAKKTKAKKKAKKKPKKKPKVKKKRKKKVKKKKPKKKPKKKKGKKKVKKKKK